MQSVPKRKLGQKPQRKTVLMQSVTTKIETRTIQFVTKVKLGH